jgi:hypothetical protein
MWPLAIDYRLTDAYADPPAHDALHSERLVRLPHSYFWYRPRDVAPLPGPLPALAHGGEVDLRPSTRREDHRDDARAPPPGGGPRPAGPNTPRWRE